MTNRALFTPPPQVLELASIGVGLCQDTQVIFLDEFRMIISPDKSGMGELTVFNTLFPQDHPGNLRRLALPQQFHDRRVRIHVDHDRPLGRPNGKEPLIADPAQTVLIVEFVSDWDPPVPLVVTMQVFVGQTHLTHRDSPVPWDEWTRDSVVMDVQIPMRGNELQTFVHGAQVVVALALCTDTDLCDWPEFYHGVQTFDFSRQGRSSMPLWGGGHGGTKRVLLFEEGGCLKFDQGEVPWKRLSSLSDGTLLYLVSFLSQSV